MLLEGLITALLAGGAPTLLLLISGVLLLVAMADMAGGIGRHGDDGPDESDDQAT